MNKTWKDGLSTLCLAGAWGCMCVGILGLVMIVYWYHVSHDWADERIYFWMKVGFPCTVGVFAFAWAKASFK